ncbi:MAG: ribosome hibernation-promoting factor, HPF/YfiA family [Luteitalea sp.]
MRLALTGRHLAITPALRLLVTRRLEKLDRLLHDSVISAQVVLQVERFRHKVDVVVHTRGDHMLTGHGVDGTWARSLTVAVDKVSQQAATQKGKWQSRTRRAVGVGRHASAEVTAADDNLADGADEEAIDAAALVVAPRFRGRPRATEQAAAAVPAPRVQKIRRASARPMNVAQAAARVDAAPGSVVVYRDATLDRVQVLVRRADGSLGLIDPEG